MSFLAKLLAETSYTVGSSGILYVAQRTFRYVVPNWLFSFNDWIIAKHEFREIEKFQGNQKIRWLEEREIDGLLELDRKLRKRFEVAFSLGERIAVYQNDGRVAAYFHLATNRHDVGDWITFKFESSSVFGSMLWVSPDYRRHGIGPELMRFAESEFAREGFQRRVYHMDSLNRASRRACEKIGHTVLGRIVCFRFLGLSYVRFGRRRRFGVWRSRNRLELELG